jgi:hypothetical protein
VEAALIFVGLLLLGLHEWLDAFRRTGAALVVALFVTLITALVIAGVLV